MVVVKTEGCKLEPRSTYRRRLRGRAQRSSRRGPCRRRSGIPRRRHWRATGCQWRPL